MPKKETIDLLGRAASLGMSNPKEAIRLLEEGLKETRQSGDQDGVGLLSKHAGAICYHIGNFAQALKYSEEALHFAPDNAYLHFMCGDLYSKLGEFNRAEACFNRCVIEATRERDDDAVDMAKAALTKNQQRKNVE